MFFPSCPLFFPGVIRQHVLNDSKFNMLLLYRISITVIHRNVLTGGQAVTWRSHDIANVLEIATASSKTTSPRNDNGMDCSYVT